MCWEICPRVPRDDCQVILPRGFVVQISGHSEMAGGGIQGKLASCVAGIDEKLSVTVVTVVTIGGCSSEHNRANSGSFNYSS